MSDPSNPHIGSIMVRGGGLAGLTATNESSIDVYGDAPSPMPRPSDLAYDTEAKDLADIHDSIPAVQHILADADVQPDAVIAPIEVKEFVQMSSQEQNSISSAAAAVLTKEESAYTPEELAYLAALKVATATVAMRMQSTASETETEEAMQPIYGLATSTLATLIPEADRVGDQPDAANGVLASKPSQPPPNPAQPVHDSVLEASITRTEELEVLRRAADIFSKKMEERTPEEQAYVEAVEKLHHDLGEYAVVMEDEPNEPTEIASRPGQMRDTTRRRKEGRRFIVNGKVLPVYDTPLVGSLIFGRKAPDRTPEEDRFVHHIGNMLQK